METRETPGSRTGIWLVGAFGSLATTVVVGARAVARGLARPLGVVTEGPEFKPLGLAGIDGLVFGGHEIRGDSLAAAAAVIARENGSITDAWIGQLGPELDAISKRVRPGIASGGGAAIESLQDGTLPRPERRGRDTVDRLAEDIRRFAKQEALDRVTVVNVASTEPPFRNAVPTLQLAELERCLDSEAPGSLRPGTLYAYAAFQAGAAYVNFTASNSCLCPAIEEFAARRQLPYAGNDGKTGETLVKSGLAPLFRTRQLEVMSWVGYNVLGNRDGRVLSVEENKQSKVDSKDSVVPSILGYSLRTHVGIDYVESLGDSKVAWDFIHFRGFLGHPMSMQFTWQGCDSILAAPLVLDLARLSDLALRQRESGPMSHLASFFKSPIHCAEHDLYRQFARLADYVDQVAKSGVPRSA